ncbi:MAG: hypothetical protein PHI67_06530 [Candidatus Methanomethylophilaceae archaeon]|jgi:hypothetical protein|nr:hypothetical protein [Candidatus Methanomethylophilaceae archaeon]
MEKRDIIIGIGLGAIICAAGIVFAPAVPAGGLGATIISGGLGSLALLVLALRRHPASVAVGTTATLGTGGYAIAAGVLTGPPAALALVLMAGVVLVAWQVLRPFWASERPPAAKAAP